MQVPETPQSVEQLDLMKRLDAYANGVVTWIEGGDPVGTGVRQACRTLHNQLIQLVNQIFAPLLDKIGSREMETFTMHDRRHGLKVAHLMWHILDPGRRERLTPPEIAMMVVSAHLHDLGMALSHQERKARLDPASDLWDMGELAEQTKHTIDELRAKIADPDTPEPISKRARYALYQAEEVLLSQHTRERHATRQRYEDLLTMLAAFHRSDPTRIPDVEAYLSYEGDSFRNKLIDICVSHNEEAEALVERDQTDFAHPRFPKDYPVGSCTADLHLIAAVLRLADILDFDRERTPPILFHYLLPTALAPEESRSILEWQKHLTISNWHIEPDAIVFRGRCNNHIIHHAVVHFCNLIAEEIAATQVTFGTLLRDPSDWPFNLPIAVKADLHAEGYRYIPYKFELDDQSVYELLMGGAIYDNPLVAVRELVQNAIDACKLRDAITRLHEPHESPGSSGRVTIRYEETTDGHPQPRLIVTDTGTGMDAWIIEKWFLRIGRSYYHSAEFKQTRVALRRNGLDFAPVSEFGIGFLSCFLLADRLTVETAMVEPIRGDTRKRTLQIDGPTRLIRLNEQRNDGPGRFKGTRVTLLLSRGGTRGEKAAPPTWEEIKSYLEDVCQELPYRLHLEYVSNGRVAHDAIDARPFVVQLPPHLEPLALRIPVNDKEVGLEGEIILINPAAGEKAEQQAFKQTSASIVQKGSDRSLEFDPYWDRSSLLLRGGFRLGWVPGLPDSFLVKHAARARLRLMWDSRANRRYILPNLSRTSTSRQEVLARQVIRIWLTHLLENVDRLPEGQLLHLKLPAHINQEGFSWLEQYDARTLYRLARQGWQSSLKGQVTEEMLCTWEESRGGSLRLGIFRNDLYWHLLDLILPRVTHLEMGPEARFYVKPPYPDWYTVFEGWRDYITSPVSWGMFVEYTRGIEDLLVYQYPGVVQFNLLFQERLHSFHDDELPSLFRVLRKFAETRGKHQAELTQDEVRLFRRAVEVIGDIKIGSSHGTWRIDSFSIASSSPLA